MLGKIKLRRRQPVIGDCVLASPPGVASPPPPSPISLEAAGCEVRPSQPLSATRTPEASELALHPTARKEGFQFKSSRTRPRHAAVAWCERRMKALRPEKPTEDNSFQTTRAPGPRRAPWRWRGAVSRRPLFRVNPPPSLLGPESLWGLRIQPSLHVSTREFAVSRSCS